MTARKAGEKPQLESGNRVLRRSIAIAILLILACGFAVAHENQATVLRRTNLRSDPSSDNSLVRRLDVDEQLQLLDPSPTNGYLHVSTMHDEDGWVYARNVNVQQVPAPSLQPGSTPPSTPTASHAGPADLYPDPNLTPGTTNPDITQDTIGDTICNHNWSTKSIRPPASYTTSLKVQQMPQYQDTVAQAIEDLMDPDTGKLDTSRCVKHSANRACYEEDHLISLELGGNPTDPKNLWPEPYAPVPGPRQKDKVENYLHDQVCSGAMTLQKAQQTIVSDWYAVYLRITNQ